MSEFLMRRRRDFGDTLDVRRMDTAKLMALLKAEAERSVSVTVYLVTTGEMSNGSLEIKGAFSTPAKAQAYIDAGKALHPTLWVHPGGVPSDSSHHDVEWYDWKTAEILPLVLDEKSE